MNGCASRARSSIRRLQLHAWARQTHHSLPRRRRRPRRQGRQLRRPARCRRSGRGRARATTSRAPTSSRSSTSPRASRSAACILHMIEAVAAQVFIPLTVGGGVRAVEDIRRLLNAGADKVSINTAAVAESAAVRARRRRTTARNASWSRSTRSACAVPTDAWEVYTHGGRTPTGLDALEWARKMQALGRRRNPADQHGSRRHAHRFRSRAHARGRRCGRRSR